MLRNSGRPRLAALATAAVLLISGCTHYHPVPAAKAKAAGLPYAVAKTGTLRVGMSPDFPPMEYLDDKTHQVAGVDIDLIRAVGKQMGVRVDIVQQSFDQLTSSVQTTRTDIAMSGLSDTVERQKTVDFVDYFAARGRIYTLKGKAGAYRKFTDACGKHLAVGKKVDYYQQIQDVSRKYCVDAGRPPIRILPADSGAAARLQLQQGRVELAAQGEENLTYFGKSDPSAYSVVMPPLPSTPFAVVIKKGDTTMANAVLKALKAVEKSGEYQRVLKAAGLGYGSTEPVINGTGS
ncbi:ABC transporter substrate-binding protein [Streptomyces sp. NBC_00963]|uniref:ABC transporter substrate-binding protein n=1 Tax=Streptomyces sp. NBC_00963 TaxID=2903697 RepID=UPI00386DED5D|nr:ABC transporter substrate-binding protein [Streptomyces sp. NBC_00963]